MNIINQALLIVGVFYIVGTTFNHDKKLDIIQKTNAESVVEIRNDIWNSSLTPDDLCYDYVKLKANEQVTASQHKLCN